MLTSMLSFNYELLTSTRGHTAFLKNYCLKFQTTSEQPSNQKHLGERM